MFTTIIHYDSGPSMGREGARGELDYSISSHAKQTVLQQGLYAALAKPRLAFGKCRAGRTANGANRAAFHKAPAVGVHLLGN